MEADILESFSGYFMDGTPLKAVPEKLKTVFSIRDNLTRLLNARLGANPFYSDYGLPEFNDVYTDLPRNLSEITAAIKRTIAKWEPRVRDAEIASWNVPKTACHLQCILAGKLPDGENCRFTIKLFGIGGNSVEFWRK